MEKFIRIIGTGSAAPDQVLTNADLEKMVDTSDEWITVRSGIKERHIAPKGKVGTDYALIASLRAMEMAGVKADEIDMIILGTVTPDAPLPSSSCILQHKLGAKNAGVMDLVAACSGFIYGLALARSLIMVGQSKTVLVVGVELLSRFVNWKDRSTCVLFGDGAGAAIVRGSNRPGGIINAYLKGDGTLAHLLQIPIGGAEIPIDASNVCDDDRYIRMEGQGVFKAAVKAMGAMEGWSMGETIYFRTLFSFADEDDFFSNMLPGYREKPLELRREITAFLRRYTEENGIVLDSARRMNVLDRGR